MQAPPIRAQAAVGTLQGRTILQIIPALDAGGAERTTIDIAAALADAGARALVATEGGRLVGELQARGGIWVPFHAATKNPFRIWGNGHRLARLIVEEKVDIVHARSRAPAWSALMAARKTGKPFVTTYHGAYSATNDWKKRYNSVMARGDVVIANSHFTAARIIEAWPDAITRVRVVHRGTDLSAFMPLSVPVERVLALRQAWGVQPHQRIVLLAGRLTPWKGQRVQIEAAAILRDRGVQDVVHILAGDPQGRDGYVHTLDTMIEDRDLAGIVRRVGHCTDMPAAFLAAACATVASTEPEAFGRIAVEAQAMGCPAIVSDIGAAPETVLAPPEVAEGARTGWRVPANDPAALADALEQALALGASARDALAARARNHVENSFSLTAMTRATLAIYKDLLRPAR
ncbi:MAG: glycosyltransferase family 4 protein [Labrys sp. (in: a-proteobacteria)]